MFLDGRHSWRDIGEEEDMSSMISKSFTIDSDRLEKEQKSYETWLEERTENAYQIASMAKAKKI